MKVANIPAHWPRMPALVQQPHASWQRASGAMQPTAVDRVERAVDAALSTGPAPTITITRTPGEVLNLLDGAPRLRTIHDMPADVGGEIAMNRDMRMHMERAKGTFHAGSTAYGVLTLRGVTAPTAVSDAFGGVALTLKPAATDRATFLPGDSMLTAQRPVGRAGLASVVTERLLRDVDLVDGHDMNGERLTPPARHRTKGALDRIATSEPVAAAALAAKLIRDSSFGAGWRYVEAQIPAVTLADVARIDVSAKLHAADRAEIVAKARAAGIPVAIA